MVRMFLLSVLSPKAAVLLELLPGNHAGLEDGEFSAVAEGESAGKRERWQKKKRLAKLCVKKISWVCSSAERKDNLKPLWNKVRVHFSPLDRSSRTWRAPPRAVSLLML